MLMLAQTLSNGEDFNNRRIIYKLERVGFIQADTVVFLFDMKSGNSLVWHFTVNNELQNNNMIIWP